jgi:hypothetical protein
MVVDEIMRELQITNNELKDKLYQIENRQRALDVNTGYVQGYLDGINRDEVMRPHYNFREHEKRR